MPASGKFTGSHQWPPVYLDGHWWTSRTLMPMGRQDKMSVRGDLHRLSLAFSGDFHHNSLHTAGVQCKARQFIIFMCIIRLIPAHSIPLKHCFESTSVCTCKHIMPGENLLSPATYSVVVFCGLMCAAI